MTLIKQKETEKFVDAYIKKHGKPPTYAVVGDKFGISHSVAWYRCKHIRNKMKNKSEITQSKTGYMQVKIEYLVPNDKFEDFAELLGQIKKLLAP